jgi:geranylgeranyl diphosphate synthase type I
MNTHELNAILQGLLPQVEAEMRRVVDTGAAGDARPPAVFQTMLRYHLGFASVDGSPAEISSGKRIRPLLTLLACQACGGRLEDGLPAAAAVELLHNFSLIHDDIEDRDELRRGRPTLWKIWGEALAINAGDALFSLAHLALERAADAGAPAGRVLRALRLFDETCLALTIGQHLDIEFENRADVTAAEYVAMIDGKTAALTRAACAIGGIMAGAPDDHVAALAAFGRELGLAFQLQDDVLGIWGDPAATGKHDSDLTHGKKTLPVLHAADRDRTVRELYFRRRPAGAQDIATLKELIEARGGRAFTEQAARDAHLKALAALDGARIDGPAAAALRALAESLLGRAA